MNIQELSVGDWVRVISDNVTAKVIGIREVYSGCTEVIAVSDTTQYMLMEEHRETRYRKLDPIPLTPEILEKNGFKLFSEKHYGFIPDIEHPYIWICNIKDSIKKNDVCIWMFEYRHNWCFHCINHGIGSSNNLGNAYITDVHELQHCLRLAKIDKEIKL